MAPAKAGWALEPQAVGLMHGSIWSLKGLECQKPSTGTTTEPLQSSGSALAGVGCVRGCFWHWSVVACAGRTRWQTQAPQLTWQKRFSGSQAKEKRGHSVQRRRSTWRTSPARHEASTMLVNQEVQDKASPPAYCALDAPCLQSLEAQGSPKVQLRMPTPRLVGPTARDGSATDADCTSTV